MKRRHYQPHYTGVRDNTSGAMPTPDDEYCEECGEEIECCTCNDEPEPNEDDTPEPDLSLNETSVPTTSKDHPDA